MAVKLANGVTVPTATDRFEYAKQIKQLGLVAGIVPKVKTKGEITSMVKALKSDPLFQGDFAWLVYVTSENKLYLHDGNSLLEGA